MSAQNERIACVGPGQIASKVWRSHPVLRVHPSARKGIVVRRLLTVVTALALALGAASVIALPAKAVQAPVAFTAKALPTWQTNGVAWAVAAANGLVFVGGTFTSVRPPGAAAGTERGRRGATSRSSTPRPVRRPSARPSSRVGRPATPTGATVRSLSVSPDQKTLYVGGFFSRSNGVTDAAPRRDRHRHLHAVTNFKPLPDRRSCTTIAVDRRRRLLRRPVHHRRPGRRAPQGRGRGGGRHRRRRARCSRGRRRSTPTCARSTLNPDKSVDRGRR